MSVYILHVEAQSIDRQDPRANEEVQNAQQYLMQFAALANSQLAGYSMDHPNKDPNDTSAFRECNIEFSIPGDLSPAVKRNAKDTLDTLARFADFTIKDKNSGKEENPFA